MSTQGNITPVLETLRAQYGWRLDDPLGKGGFSYVYRERIGGIPFAVKISKSAVPEGTSIDLPELQTALGLTGCPGLLTLIKYQLVHGHLVTVWELADQSLEQHLQQLHKGRNSGIAAEALLGYMLNAAEGIDCLNKLGFFHRDIKPSNLFLVKGRVKVGDLGLARFDYEATRRMAAVDTITYLPPEAMRGILDPSIDRYGLIVTYVSLRTGRRPFGTSLSEIMQRKWNGAPILDGLKPGEAYWVSLALSADRQRRPAGSAVDWVASLAAATGTELPVETRAASATTSSMTPGGDQQSSSTEKPLEDILLGILYMLKKSIRTHYERILQLIKKLLSSQKGPPVTL